MIVAFLDYLSKINTFLFLKPLRTNCTIVKPKNKMAFNAAYRNTKRMEKLNGNRVQ